MSTKGSSALSLKHNTIYSRLASNKYYLVPINRMEDARWFLKQLYDGIDDTNFITILTKHAGSVAQWSLTYSSLIQEKNLMNILSLKDTYISINTFYKFSRKQKDVRRLNACFVDIDYYKVQHLNGLKPEELIQKMRENGLFKDLEPSFFVASGQGLYIFYLLHNASKHCSKLYRKLQDALYEKFKNWGADKRARDISRVLRLAGTVHSATGNEVRIIFNSDKFFRFEQMQEPVRRYTIDELSKALLPQLPYSKAEWLKLKAQRKKRKQEAQNRAKKGTVSRLFNIQNLNWHRIKDLEKLQELRGKDVVGKREFMCYLYRLWQLHVTGDEAQALQNTLVFNSNFVEPLTDEEVIKATASAEENYRNYLKAVEEYEKLENKPSWAVFAYQRNCNLYSNKTLIKELEITTEEQKYLSTIVSAEVKRERKREANKQYYETNKQELLEKAKNRYKEKVGMSKKEQIELEKQKIKSLLEQGFKKKDICTKLGIHQRTLQRRIKELQKEGLLQ